MSWRFCLLSSLILLASLSLDECCRLFFQSVLTTHQSPGLASASRVDHLPLCQSRPTGYPLPSPVLTPSSLPWQTHLCPSLPLSLQIRLLDSRIYISDLDLLSRFYRNIQSWTLFPTGKEHSPQIESERKSPKSQSTAWHQQEQSLTATSTDFMPGSSRCMSPNKILPYWVLFLLL